MGVWNMPLRLLTLKFWGDSAQVFVYYNEIEKFRTGERRVLAQRQSRKSRVDTLRAEVSKHSSRLGQDSIKPVGYGED